MTLATSFENILTVQTLFETPEGDRVNNEQYCNIILGILKKILPADFFEFKESMEATWEHQKALLKQVIPLVSCSEARNFPGTASFFAFSHYCQNSFKFFFEMISRWLIPGRRLDVVLIYASDFCLPELSQHVYTVCEVMVKINTNEEFQEIQRHFPIIGSEITLGINSVFYAQRILEIKGLSADEKTALIQACIMFLVKRYPQIYGTDVFTEMQHVLVMCREDFKAARNARHLSRIVGIQYLFRKTLRETIKKNAQRRHFNLKIFRAVIQLPQGRKRVLGVLVVVNLLKDHDIFGEKHLLKAIHHYIPSAQPVENSFFINKIPPDPISTIYLEIEKNDETEFTYQEIKKLRRVLPSDLKNRVEHKLSPIFMPRNEEEIMRNVLNLTEQIKFVRDIPQVFISFDEQTSSHLIFTVILARHLKPPHKPIADLFKSAESFLEYIPDRIKILGYVRKKYAKEATVFHLKLLKDNFLRADHSVDLYKARQTVLGEVRDFNGGMIFKQYEALSSIRKLLTDVKDYNELLLENFFYSLSPVVVRALLDPKAFKTLFLMLLEGLKEYKQEGYYLKLHMESYNVFVLVIFEDPQLKESLSKAVADLQITPTELAASSIRANGNTCLGYICCSHGTGKKELLFQRLQDTLNAWESLTKK